MKEIRILFDGPPNHESGRFVEVEDESGKSIRVGEWRERHDGLWELVLDPGDLVNRPDPNLSPGPNPFLDLFRAALSAAPSFDLVSTAKADGFNVPPTTNYRGAAYQVARALIQDPAFRALVDAEVERRAE